MIYLDFNATSPLLPEARAKMEPWWGTPANASSIHQLGQRAAAALEEARAEVAALVGGLTAGVVFTSGATEANHLAITGLYQQSGRSGWVVSAVEHPCVHGAASLLRAWGAHTSVWPVDERGVVQVGPLDTSVAGVSCMAVNHEIGVIQPWEEALRACRAAGARLHVDAAQALYRLDLDLSAVDAVTLSAHKLGGPVGIGALVLRDGEPFPSLFRGGSQERGRRAGTTPVALAVGFGEAARLARAGLAERRGRWRSLTERLREALRGVGARELGIGAPRVPGVVAAVFPGIRGEQVVQALDLAGFAVSGGAACASGSLRPSPVLTAMGDPEPDGIVRFSLGASSTEADISRLAATLPAVVQTLRDGLAWGEDP